jgi:hypothetical protein
LGSLSSFQVEQPKDDNNFNNVNIERKTRKEKEKKTRKRDYMQSESLCAQRKRENLCTKRTMFSLFTTNKLTKSSCLSSTN